MTNWLPEDAGAQLRFDFENESARLNAAQRSVHPLGTRQAVCFLGKIGKQIVLAGPSDQPGPAGKLPAPAARCQSPSHSDRIRTEALNFCFDAFSLREPVSTSLENAIGSQRQGTPASLLHTEREDDMPESIYKVIELIGTSSKSWEEAAANAVQQASRSLRDLRVAEVIKLDMQLDDKGKVEAYRAKLSVSFKFEGS
jgi:flavin-binding protein dodecin